MHNSPNRFFGTVKSLMLGDVAAEVAVSVGQLEFISLIPHSSAEALGLKTGDKSLDSPQVHRSPA